jgi:hypothetical protein
VRPSLRLSEDASVVAGETLRVGVGEYSNAVASGVGIHGPCILEVGCVASVESEKAFAGSVLLRRVTLVAGK